MKPTTASCTPQEGPGDHRQDLIYFLQDGDEQQKTSMKKLVDDGLTIGGRWPDGGIVQENPGHTLWLFNIAMGYLT